MLRYHVMLCKELKDAPNWLCPQFLVENSSDGPECSARVSLLRFVAVQNALAQPHFISCPASAELIHKFPLIRALPVAVCAALRTTLAF